MEIKQSYYMPDNEIYFNSNSIILNPNVYNDLKEHFRKEFEKERKLKWYEKVINTIKKLLNK